MKVRIRKALPHETPGYNSNLNSFLNKAANGMEVQDTQEEPMQSQEADSTQVIDYIKSLFEGGEYFENVVAKFSKDYNIDTDQASDFVKYVQDNYLEDPLLFGDDEDKVKEDEVVDVEEDPVEEPTTYDYNLNEDGIASGDFGDGLDLQPDDVMKFGGSKSKTIKHFKKLLKAAAGTSVEGQANEKDSQPNIRGTIDNPSDPYNNNINFIGAINNQVKDNFYTKQAEKMYEQQANDQYGFGGNRRIRRANKAFFGTKTAPVGVDTDYKFGLLGNLKEGTIKWDPEMATNMMQQFGANQGYHGFGYDPGYGGGSWNSSYNTGWKKTTVPGTIRREKVIKAINAQADPTKVNNVALNTNTNGTTTTNTEWQNSNKVDAKLADDALDAFVYHNINDEYVSSGMPDFEFTPGIYENQKWSSPVSQVDYINADDKRRNKKGEVDQNLYDKLSEEEKDILRQNSYLQKDSQGNEYSVKEGFGTPEFRAEDKRLQLDSNNKKGLYELNQRFNSSGYEDGGFVDPSQMQPGVLQKFISGGYDDISQEDIDFTNSKDTTGSYAYGGYLPKALYGQSTSYDSKDPEFANKEAYNAAVANGLTDEEYNPNTTYTGVNSNYSKANNTNNTDRHTTRNTTTTTNTYNNQGYNQGPNQGWYDPREAAFAIPNGNGGGNGSFRDMIRDFLPVTNDGTWFNQTAGSLGAIPEGYALNQVKTSKQRKTDGTWAERKLGFNKDRFVDMSYTELGANDKPGTNDKPGVGVYAPGQGVNSDMKPGATTTTTVPGATTNTIVPTNTNTTVNTNAKEEPEGNTDMYARRDERYNNRNDRRMERRGYSENSDVAPVSDEEYMQKYKASLPVANEEYMQKYNANNLANKTSDDQSEAEYMQKYNDSKAQTQKINEQIKAIPSSFGFENGGYIPNDYYAYGGYLPKADDGLVGPFVTNNADCTDQQKRDPQSPCYDSKFAIPAFARPGATIQEMMGIDSINCSDEDKLDPESDCYVDPNPDSITKRFKMNKAKTTNFGAFGTIGNIAGNLGSGIKEASTNVKLGNVDKAKIYTSMGKEDMKDTEFRGTTNQEGWDPNAGYESTGRMTAGFAKGGPVNKEGDITYMSSKQIKEFLKNGGQLEFQ